MSVAQGLYEGVKIPEKGTVGLITYMRTDSTRISEEARECCKKHILKRHMEKNIMKIDIIKPKTDAQDAHEAIRPTYVDLTPEKVKS